MSNYSVYTEPDYDNDDNTTRWSGTIPIRGFIEIIDYTLSEQSCFETAFGDDNKEISWDAFAARYPEDYPGVVPLKEMLHRLRETTDKFIKKWMDYVDYDNCGCSEYEQLRISSVDVSPGGADIYFQCDYHVTVDELDRVYNDRWCEEETAQGFANKLTDSEGEIISEGDFWVDINFDSADIEYDR